MSITQETHGLSCGRSIAHPGGWKPVWMLFSEITGNNREDFIIEDGVLKTYHGRDVRVVIPDTVTRIEKRAFSTAQT